MEEFLMFMQVLTLLLAIGNGMYMVDALHKKSGWATIHGIVCGILTLLTITYLKGS